jgi:ubiquinone/menaquinone biosynthesis C-methylase UbiE
MIKRTPLECGIFEDEERARKYSRESGKWMQNIAQSFISIVENWNVICGRVLDVGTGPGSLAVEFAKKIPGVEVVGLDLSDIVLAVAQENARRNDVSSQVFFKKGDAEDMPFKNDTFDLIISSNTLHLLQNPVRMFDEVQRVLNSDGKFIISDFRRSLLGIFTAHIRASYSPDEVTNLLNQSELLNWEVKNSFLWLTVLSKQVE